MTLFDAGPVMRNVRDLSYRSWEFEGIQTIGHDCLGSPGSTDSVLSFANTVTNSSRIPPVGTGGSFKSSLQGQGFSPLFNVSSQL